MKKLLPLGLAGLALAIVSIFFFSSEAHAPKNSLASLKYTDQDIVISSEPSSGSVSTNTEHKEGDYYISPELSTMHWADKKEFTSYIETSSGAVAVASKWEVSKNFRTELLGCEDPSKTCTILTDVGDQTFTLTASHQSKSDSMTIKPSFTIVNPFADELPNWADHEIVSLYNRGIIQGYQDGRYGAGDPVTRAQYVLLVQRMGEYIGVDFSQVTQGQNCDIFADLKPDHYAYEAVCAAKTIGWLDGIIFPQGKFGPDQVLKRDIAAQITYNSMIKGVFASVLNGRNPELLTSLIQSEAYEYTDITANTPYKEAILSASFLDIMTGSEEGLFNPQGDLNRAQAAVILWRTKYSINQSDLLY